GSVHLTVCEHRIGAGPHVPSPLGGCWRRGDFFALLAILAVTTLVLAVNLSHRSRRRALRPDAGFAAIAHVVEPMVDLLRQKGLVCDRNVAVELKALRREEFVKRATWLGAETNQAQKVLHPFGWPARDRVEDGADPLFIAGESERGEERGMYLDHHIFPRESAPAKYDRTTRLGAGEKRRKQRCQCCQWRALQTRECEVEHVAIGRAARLIDWAIDDREAKQVHFVIAPMDKDRWGSVAERAR